MLRKGQVKQLAGMMLVVVSIATVVSTFNSIQDHTLDDSSEGLMDSLEQYNPEVKIENEQQLRGLTTWNVLASQQCIYANMIYKRTDVGDIPSDVNVKPKHLRMSPSEDAMTDSGPYIQNVEGNEFTFFGDVDGEDDPLRTLIDETAFQGQCMGTDPISATQGWGAVIGEMTPNIGWTGLEEFQGYSVEGRYGQVSYNMKDTVILEDEKLFAMRIPKWWWGDWFSGNGPDFIRAQRASVFIPPNNPDQVLVNRWEAGDSGEGDQYVEGYGSVDVSSVTKGEQARLGYLGEKKRTGDGGISNYNFDPAPDASTLWAFRVRMLNIPMIYEGDRFDVLINENQEVRPPYEQFKEFIQRTDYVMCKGSEGNIKSNAGKDPSTDGVTRGTHPVPRDVVYPKIEAFSGIKSCFGENVATDHFGDGRFVPIGEKMYFNEDQELNMEGLGDDSYWGPEIEMEDDILQSKDYGNLRIGKYDGEYIKLPVESKLATPVAMGLDWFEGSSTMAYSKEFAVDTDECPRGGIPYDVSEMFRSDGGHHVDNIYTRDGEGIGFDPGSRVIYPLNRFNSDRLDARIDIDMIWGGKSKINITAYSEAGREMKAKVAVGKRLGESTSEERNYVRYKIFDQDDGNALSNYDFDDVHTHEPDYLNVTYYKDEDDTQYMELDFGRWGDGWAGGEEHQVLTASIDAGSEDIQYIAIEGDGGSNSAKAGFTVDDFTVNAPAAGCEPPANSGGLAR